MAAITADSLRRVLGDRDVNKLVSSPSKNRDEGSTKGNNLLLPMIGTLHRSPVGSPSKKRNAEALDEGVQLLGRKRTAIEEQRADLKYGVEMDIENVQTVHEGEGDAASGQSTPPGSLSPDTSFDDSQNTVITEPEDLAPLPAPMVQPVLFQTVTPPRTMTKQEARSNAEALRLRLEFAMYKVRTNQTDVPLSQLQLRRVPSPRPSLLNLRARPNIQDSCLSDLPLPQVKLPQSDGQVDVTDMPSSPPPTPKVDAMELGTPRLPRNREQYLNPGESPEKRLTSSVVKGRAADGLLSLMGRG